MQQLFSTRPYSVRDFEEWYRKGELVLAPKFQRRNVWNPKARSYLIDTIIRGKPIPKIYMRQDVNPETRRVIREVVDGQQRLRSVISFLEDGFPIYKVHNEEIGGKLFSELDDEYKREILRYEFSVDLLQDLRDEEIYDIFARLNTYSVTLNAQELRNAKYFGEFKTTVYQISNEFITFWQINGIFSDQNILRMAEAEFVSELLIAMSVGFRARSKSFIDGFYKDHDDSFPNRTTLVSRFRKTMDIIGSIFGDSLAQSKFSEPRLLYPLFCSIYHMQFGLPELGAKRSRINQSDFSRVRIALEGVEDIFRRVEEEAERQKRLEAGEPLEEVVQESEEIEEEADYAEEEITKEEDPLTREERAFYEAYSVHWVHAENRRIRIRYICDLIINVLK